MRHLARLALFGLVVAGIAGSAPAQEKKGEKKTLEGKLVCGKCKLNESKACSNVLVVKEGDKEVKYYLKDKGKGETYHKCAGEKEVKVTGTVTTVKEDGEEKKVITDAKVEDKK